MQGGSAHGKCIELHGQREAHPVDASGERSNPDGINGFRDKACEKEL